MIEFLNTYLSWYPQYMPMASFWCWGFLAVLTIPNLINWLLIYRKYINFSIAANISAKNKSNSKDVRDLNKNLADVFKLCGRERIAMSLLMFIPVVGNIAVFYYAWRTRAAMSKLIDSMTPGYTPTFFESSENIQSQLDTKAELKEANYIIRLLQADKVEYEKTHPEKD